MAKMTPTVQGDRLVYQQDEYEQVLEVETPAWYAWLETTSTFAFTSDAGSFTARKERAGNQRGGWYWKAYRTQHGKLTSHYLGKSEALTQARLHAVAQALAHPLVRPGCHCYSNFPREDSISITRCRASPAQLLAFDQTPCSASTRTACPALPPRQATPARGGRGAHTRLGTCGLWQNHPARPMARRERYARCLAVVRAGGQRAYPFSLLRGCRSADA